MDKGLVFRSQVMVQIQLKTIFLKKMELAIKA